MTNNRHLVTALVAIAASMALIAPTSAQSRCAPDRHAPIEAVVDTPYDQFRAKLLESGWQPRAISPMRRAEGDVESGNGPDMIEAGFHELVSCAGTGLAECRFEFTDVYSNRLVVITRGEVWEEQPFPFVSQFAFECGS